MQLRSFPPTSTSSLPELYFLFVKKVPFFDVLKQVTSITMLQLVSFPSHSNLEEVKGSLSALHPNAAPSTTSSARKRASS